MGYRSDVYIRVAETHEQSFAALVNQVIYPDEPSTLAGMAAHVSEDTIVFESIKWYPSYKGTEAMMAYLSLLDEAEFGFIRIGEDTEDIEILGDPWAYGLELQRSVDY